MTVFLLARGYPSLHIAMIFDDGLVYDFSVIDKSLQDMNLLMKLPKSKQYFGYSDDNGVIYFIHSETTKGITKFHKSFNNKGHITVSKSKRHKALMMGKESQGFQFQYSHGVLLGNMFWTFGGSMIHFYGGFEERIEFDGSNRTTIWSTKKNVWTKGPEVRTSGSTHTVKSRMLAFLVLKHMQAFSDCLWRGFSILMYCDLLTKS